MHRGKMLKIPAVYDILKNLIGAISQLYEVTRGRIVTPDGELDYFELLVELLVCHCDRLDLAHAHGSWKK